MGLNFGFIDLSDSDLYSYCNDSDRTGEKPTGRVARAINRINHQMNEETDVSD